MEYLTRRQSYPWHQLSKRLGRTQSRVYFCRRRKAFEHTIRQMYRVKLFLYNVHQLNGSHQNYIFHSRLSHDRYCIFAKRHMNYCVRLVYKHVQ